MAKQAICSAADCDKAAKARGLCSAHYYRFHKAGLANKGTKHGEPWAYIERAVLPYEGDDCLIWPFGRNTNGRGMVWRDGQMLYVEHIACTEANGPRPTPEFEVAHSCGKGHLGCVAKKHLRWATHVENMADTHIHGTSRRGPKNWSARLTEESVREIRALEGIMLKREIAALYGITRHNVSYIHRGLTWGWLK